MALRYTLFPQTKVVYATGAIDIAGLDETFAHVFEGGKAKFIPNNKKAFELGYEYAKNL
mgnify:CR=1 FL=1